MARRCTASHDSSCGLKHTRRVMQTTSLGTTFFTILPTTTSDAEQMRMSLSLHTASRTTNVSGGFLGPCLSPRTTLGRSLYQLHQLVPVRQFNIRRVITKKKSSEATTTQHASSAIISKTFVENQAIAPADKLLEGHLSTPLRTVQHTNGSGSRLEHVNIRNWRSNLILPPKTYFDKWSSALRELDAGGLHTAEAFVGRWSDGLPKTSFRGGRRLIECISEFSMPLLGLRKVVSYGRDRVSLEILGFHVRRD
jgi:hypothetical protein